MKNRVEKSIEWKPAKIIKWWYLCKINFTHESEWWVPTKTGLYTMFWPMSNPTTSSWPCQFTKWIRSWFPNTSEHHTNPNQTEKWSFHRGTTYSFHRGIVKGGYIFPLRPPIGLVATPLCQTHLRLSKCMHLQSYSGSGGPSQSVTNDRSHGVNSNNGNFTRGVYLPTRIYPIPINHSCIGMRYTQYKVKTHSVNNSKIGILLVGIFFP